MNTNESLLVHGENKYKYKKKKWEWVTYCIETEEEEAYYLAVSSNIISVWEKQGISEALHVM